jgi:hypothetical protein
MTLFNWDRETWQRMLEAAERGETIQVRLSNAEDPDVPPTDLTDSLRVSLTDSLRVSFTPTVPAERVPSGEHTSADTDDVVGRIDSAIEDWETDGDAATWRADGSHEHDPPYWTRMDYGGGYMGQTEGHPLSPYALGRNGPAFYDEAFEVGPAAGVDFSDLRATVNDDRPAFTWTFRDEPVRNFDTEGFRAAVSNFVDSLREMGTAARRIHLQLGRRSGRDAVMQAVREALRQRRWSEAARGGQVAPYADLEPLELPTIRPGDEVVVRGMPPCSVTAEDAVAEHERRSRANWPGAQT